jgi:multidrug resistance efflux pump
MVVITDLKMHEKIMNELMEQQHESHYIFDYERLDILQWYVKPFSYFNWTTELFSYEWTDSINATREGYHNLGTTREHTKGYITQIYKGNNSSVHQGERLFSYIDETTYNEHKNLKERLEKEKKDRLKHELAAERYPLEILLDTFIKRLEEDTIKGDNKFLTLYLKLKEILQKTSKIPLEQRPVVADDILRINQVETLIDVYSEKIKKVKQDESLQEEEKEEKIETWKRLQEKHISEIEGA